jgi:phosphatidylinositol alpha-1,6-mannosyltransferase
MRKIDIFITTEVRLQSDPDGNTDTPHTAALHARWTPFAKAFGSVTVVGRRRIASEPTAGRVNGPEVEVLGLPYYHGLKSMILTMPKVIRAVSKVGVRGDIFIGRLPEPLSLLLFARSIQVRGRFISLVVADPKQLGQSFLPGRAGTLVGSILAHVTRWCVRRSTGVIYVTQTWLQGLYPASDGVPVLARSNVALTTDSFVDGPRTLDASAQRLRLVTVSTLGSPAKGVDVLLECLSNLKNEGLDVQLDVVGGGGELTKLQDLARHLGIQDHVKFHGHVSDRRQVVALLDAADVYISASRVEGLPRALVEAQARGLPVVSTDAGGTSELVEQDLLVAIGDVEALSQKTRLLISDPSYYEATSIKSLASAHAIQESARESRLVAFLQANFVVAGPGSTGS